jgi:two-component system NarL family sensor kinase
LANANQSQAILLGKQKLVLILLIGVLVSAFILALLLYSRYKAKQKTLLLEETARQEKLRFRAMLESEEKERMRIAKELHDSLGQMLSTARLNVSALNGSVPKEDEDLLNTSLKIIDNACEEVRSISHNMMPAALMRLGLVKAVQEMVSEINRAHRLKAELVADEAIRFTEEKEIAVYRIIQEVVNNMIRHAGATEISIQLSASSEKISLAIKDNGKGFDAAEISDSKGLGWKNSFSRVGLLNGTMAVDSVIGKGTAVLISFPA